MMDSKFLKLYNLIMEETNQNTYGSNITQVFPCLFFNANENTIPLNQEKLKNKLIQLIKDSRNRNVFQYTTLSNADLQTIMKTFQPSIQYYLLEEKVLQAQQILNGLFQINSKKKIKSTYWTNITGTKPLGFSPDSTSDLCIQYEDGTWEGISLKAQKTGGKTGVKNPTIKTFLQKFMDKQKASSFLLQMNSKIWSIYNTFFNSFLKQNNDDQLLNQIKNINQNDFLNKSKFRPGKWGLFLKKFVEKYEINGIKQLNKSPFLESKNVLLDDLSKLLNTCNLKNAVLLLNQGSQKWPVRIWKASNNKLIELTGIDEKIINTIKNGENLEFKKISSVNCRLFIDNKDIMTFQFRCSHDFKQLFGTTYTYKGSNLSSIYTIPFFDKVFVKIDQI